MSSDPLAIAIRSGDAAQVAAVIAQHPQLKTQLNQALPGGDFGATPLLAAVQTGNREVIDVLLNAGADINQRSHWWAGGFGVLDNDGGLAPYLIERGAVVDAYAAARLGMLERLKTLIADDPAVVHMRGGDGQTPLHVASSIEIAELLLAHGADIDARDVDHESTPAQYLLRDRPHVAKYLVSRGCRTDILMLAALGDLDGVRRVLDADPAAIGVSVSAEHFPMYNPHAGGTIYQWVLGRRKTPHLVAREFGHQDVFDWLMSRSPDNVKLVQACMVGDEALADTLVAQRPDRPLVLTPGEQRAVVDAAEDNNLAAVRVMLRVGWPPDARGAHGSTALHFAAWHGNAAMAREILTHHPPLEAADADYHMSPLGWALHGSQHGWFSKTGDYGAVVEALLDAGAKAPAVTRAADASAAVREVLARRGKLGPEN